MLASGPPRGGHRASERLRSPSRAGGGFLLDGSLWAPRRRTAGPSASGLYRSPRRSSSAAFASVLHSCARPSARGPPSGDGPSSVRGWGGGSRAPFGVGGRSCRRAARGCPRPSAQRSTAFPLPSDAPAASRPRRGRGTCPRSARRRNVGAFGTQALYRSFRTSLVGSSSRRSLGPSVASPATSGGWGRPRAKRALRAPDRPSSRGVARYVAPVGR